MNDQHCSKLRKITGKHPEKKVSKRKNKTKHHQVFLNSSQLNACSINNKFS